MKRLTHKAIEKEAHHTDKSLTCYKHTFLPTLIALCFSVVSYGQIPEIETPRQSTLNQVQVGNSNPTVNPTPYTGSTTGMADVQIQNQNMIRQIEQSQRQNSYSQLEELYNELNHSPISYQLPDLNSLKGTEYFEAALLEINEMLIGKRPLDLKKAVFIVENAYFENKLDYKQFENSIKNAVDVCQLKMVEYKLSEIDDFIKNVTIFNYISDTTSVKLSGQEKTLTHYPIKYDFNDYSGTNNWSNMFVSKLMATNSGQCHSMPLYYLILAQELGAKSFMSYSPNHSFVRFKSQKGNWYNAELTCGAIISDVAILESGYVKTEAIKSGIYMDTLSVRETVACMINTLANGYARKYGHDSFVKKCADTVLKHYPNQLNALMLESNWQTQTIMYIAKQKGNPKRDVLIQDPRAKIEFEKMHKVYSQIDALGYEFMPEEHYLKWLKSLEAAKQKPENQKSLINQFAR